MNIISKKRCLSINNKLINNLNRIMIIFNNNLNKIILIKFKI